MKTSLFILIFLLTSCGGGGGGGGGGSSAGSAVTYGNPSWISSASTSDISSYKTTEYNAQWGLTKINAAEAYALLAANSKTVAGSGIKIGIIDTGVQTNHVEIANNYSSSGGYDYVNSDSNPSDDNGHGTHVASIAAGVKDDSGMHGVAYDATIIAEKVLDSTGSGLSNNVASGIDAAVSAGAKVINLSLGGNSSSDIRTALLTAKSSDVLSVAATGNSTASQPEYPAGYASDSSLTGYVLAVGAIGYDGTIASYSNYCGDAKSYCLVAPGGSNDGNSSHAIYGAVPTDSYAYYNGTSMATPHVAGAAAVIRGAWTFLTAPQTVQILLQSANRSFSGYSDTIYGQGILDLEAAVQAQGQNTLGYGTSVVSSAGYDVRTSSIASSSIFGDAFTTSVAPQLSSAIFYDDFGRDYKASLGDRISEQRPVSPGAVSNVSYKSMPLQLGKNHLNFSLASQNSYAAIDRSQDRQISAGSGFSFTRHETSLGSKFGFAFNFDEISAQQNFANTNFILRNGFTANPYQSFMRDSSGANRKFNQAFFSQDFLQKKVALHLSYQESRDSSIKQNQVADFGLSFKNISLSFGSLTEFQNNVLNSKSLGAFESPGDVKTSYFKFSLNQQLAKDFTFFASLSEGVSKINGNSQGIFREFNDVRSRSFSAGFSWKNFGLNYLEPMRVYRGKVKFDIPVARDDAGNLYRYQGTASLVSQGRERDLEMFYLYDLNNLSQIKFTFLTQRQPGNIKGASTNFLGLVSYKKFW